MSVEGDIIDFRVFQGFTFAHLVQYGKEYSRKVFGMDTFAGLPPLSRMDYLKNGSPVVWRRAYSAKFHHTKRNLDRILGQVQEYDIIEGDLVNSIEKLPKNTSYAFALLDLKLFQSTQHALNFLWDNMSYGGTILVLDYTQSDAGADLAIDKFISEKSDMITVSKRLIVNGKRENHLIIKCYNNKNKKTGMFSRNSNEPITIASVLKTGGSVYNASYVNALANAIRDNVSINYKFVCLTDDGTGLNENVHEVIPLIHDFPSWWSKIELFRPGIFDTKRVFYLDLDTVIIDNIDEIVTFDAEFAGLYDFYNFYKLGSGLMAWDTNSNSEIYTDFLLKSSTIIKNYKEGDQQWINEKRQKIYFLQDNFPRQIVSFKKDCVKNGEVEIPPSTKIICFHGEPRPHEITDSKIRQYWCPHKY